MNNINVNSNFPRVRVQVVGGTTDFFIFEATSPESPVSLGKCTERVCITKNNVPSSVAHQLYLVCVYACTVHDFPYRGPEFSY